MEFVWETPSLTVSDSCGVTWLSSVESVSSYPWEASSLVCVPLSAVLCVLSVFLWQFFLWRVKSILLLNLESLWGTGRSCYLPKFHRDFCKYVRLTVCLSVRLSVCLARDTGRNFLTIVTELGPPMKSCTRKNPIVFLGQRSNNWVTRSKIDQIL